jgi:hypothetical protein
MLIRRAMFLTFKVFTQGVNMLDKRKDEGRRKIMERRIPFDRRIVNLSVPVDRRTGKDRRASLSRRSDPDRRIVGI